MKRKFKLEVQDETLGLISKMTKVRFTESALLERTIRKISGVRRVGYLRENAIRIDDRINFRRKQETRISFTIFEKYVLL